jgi:hypothetical protein
VITPCFRRVLSDINDLRVNEEVVVENSSTHRSKRARGECVISTFSNTPFVRSSHPEHEKDKYKEPLKRLELDRCQTPESKNCQKT